ncbi:hypothetical protein TcBrA4_0102380 [Trypanosoma cruzi]|nr:hypothetical protein TcBrA4_0102380 [Trypanosoma cruzi]
MGDAVSSPRAENFAYPQEYAAVQQQDGEEPYEGCYHPAFHGGACIAVGDEYVGSILAGAGNEEVMQVDGNPRHAASLLTLEGNFRGVEKEGRNGFGGGTATFLDCACIRGAPHVVLSPLLLLLC